MFERSELRKIQDIYDNISSARREPDWRFLVVGGGLSHGNMNYSKSESRTRGLVDRDTFAKNNQETN